MRVVSQIGKTLFPQALIYRNKDKGPRDKEGENERTVNMCGTDEYKVAECCPKEYKQEGLGTVETATHRV